MTVAHINPVMLRWAMQRADVDVAELGEVAQKPLGVVTAWLDGSVAPTFKQAQQLAKRLYVPFGYLFLSAPPGDEVPLPDFRRMYGEVRPAVSIDLRDVISDVLRKQDWYRDYRLDQGKERLPFVGSLTINSLPREVATDIRGLLCFEAKVRPHSQADQFMRAFVRQVDALDVLVMRNGIVRHSTNRALDVDEFRGFSLADPIAPVIFVNNADSRAAQVFTLAHELGHIWIGQSGISHADLTLTASGPGDVESFCNAVAGELLLPWEGLRERWDRRVGALNAWITQVGREFHVSSVMVARQLWSYGLISREQFFEVYEAEKAKWVKGTSSGGDFYRTVPIRNSRLLTEAVLESVNAAETSIRDASRLLGVKPANLSKLEESMSAR